jgi:hypothetical protein
LKGFERDVGAVMAGVESGGLLAGEERAGATRVWVLRIREQGSRSTAMALDSQEAAAWV